MVSTGLHFNRLNILFVWVLFVHCVLDLYLDAVDCLTFASFIFAYLYYQGLTHKIDGEMYLVDDITVTFGLQYHAAQRDLYLSCTMRIGTKSKISLGKVNANRFQIRCLWIRFCITKALTYTNTYIWREHSAIVAHIIFFFFFFFFRISLLS